MGKSPMIYLRVPPDMLKAIQEEAEGRDTDESVIIREALKEYFAKRGKKLSIRMRPKRITPEREDT